MESVTLTLFSDTGGLLLLDPESAADLGEDFLEHFEIALDPEGASDMAAERDGDWPAVRARAVEALRRQSARGEFALLLTGEGTFHARVQTDELTGEERADLVESFEERLRVRSGRLALTDGVEFFGEEVPGEGAWVVEVPDGDYKVEIHHLGRHPSLTPTVGVHGSEEHPALVLRLVAAEFEESGGRGADEFPRLRVSREGYDEPREGWDCYGQVTGVEGGSATVELMLTETTYSADYARMDVPEGEELKAGDYVLVRLIENAGDYWRAEWQDEPST
jgi:hypothetical protein